MDSNKEDSDQLLRDGDIALEAALENTRVSQDLYLTLWSIDFLMDSNKEDSDQLPKNDDIALEAVLENTLVSQDLFNPLYTYIDLRVKLSMFSYISVCRCWK